jgi:hypothetical protein
MGSTGFCTRNNAPISFVRRNRASDVVHEVVTTPGRSSGRVRKPQRLARRLLVPISILAPVVVALCLLAHPRPHIHVVPGIRTSSASGVRLSGIYMSTSGGHPAMSIAAYTFLCGTAPSRLSPSARCPLNSPTVAVQLAATVTNLRPAVPR